MLKRLLKRLLKHGRSFLAWSCFALALAVMAWIGTLSPSYQKCAAEHERHYGNNESTNLHERSPERREFMPVFVICEGAFIDENSGTLAALATIAIAGFTLTLWRATTEHGRITDRVLKLTGDEFNATHRPKIRIKHVWLLSDIWAGEKIRVELVFVNTGTAKAIIQQVSLRALLVPSGDDLPARPPDAAIRGIIREMGIGETFTIVIDDAGYLTLTDADNEAIRERKKTLYCFGAVDYADNIGGWRKTAFCRVLKLPRVETAQLKTARFVRHDDDNYEYED